MKQLPPSCSPPGKDFSRAFGELLLKVETKVLRIRVTSSRDHKPLSGGIPSVIYFFKRYLLEFLMCQVEVLSGNKIPLLMKRMHVSCKCHAVMTAIKKNEAGQDDSV